MLNLVQVLENRNQVQLEERKREERKREREGKLRQKVGEKHVSIYLKLSQFFFLLEGRTD